MGGRWRHRSIDRDRRRLDGRPPRAGAVDDVTQYQAELAARVEQAARLREGQGVVWRLAGLDAVAAGDLAAVSRSLTEAVAELSAVERVSVWMLTAGAHALTLVNLFERGPGRHSDGVELRADDYPRYFEALASGRAIDAHVARTDPRTSEFRTGYLEPLGISSMLDAAVRVSGEVVGVVCHEHVGAPRTWTTEEMALAGAVADIVAHTILTGRLRRANAELEQRVAERTREIESFTYSVSHDLRAPLRHLNAYASILLDEARERLTPDDRKHLDAIAGEARKMGRLVDDLLKLSRLGRHRLERSDVNMRELVREVWAELRPDRAELALGDLPRIRADESLVRQVWTNLLDNAVKYSAPREQPRIEVAAEQRGDRCWYCVRDNGVGFDPRHVNKLFGVFQRLHAAGEFPGTGIGLSLVHRIVTMHGGAVEARSDGASGATFSFALA